MPFRIRVSLLLLAAIAAAVLILPLVWPVPPLEDTRAVDELAGPDAAWLEAPEARLHARVRGGDEGPAFVFVHGYGSQLEAFAGLQDALAERGRPTIAYDRPGFGLSERPLSGWARSPYGHEAQVDHVRVAMEALGADRAVLIGAGAGGSIALRAALAHPERVAGLVLVAPDVEGGGGVPPAARPLLWTPQLARIGPLLMRQLGGEPGESLVRAAYADPARVPPATLEAHRRATSVHDWDRALWEVTRAGRAPSVIERLDEVRAPVLVVAGSEDAVVPLEATRRTAAALPEARLEIVEGCGHRVHDECTAAVAAAVADWLEGLDALGAPDAVARR